MTKEQLYEAIGSISEKHIREGEDKMKKKNTWVKRCALAAACLTVVIVSGFFINNMLSDRAPNEATNVNEGAGGTLLGAGDIYPTLMVNGRLYEWHKGAAILEALPENSVYYGEVVHVDGKTPADNCEFVSVFPASGKIYTVQNNEEHIYILLTTSWFSDKVVMFDLI